MALNSMTGFARDGGEWEGWTWTWELKSVNAKGLDVRLRVPMGFDALEPQARNLISNRFTRGNVTAGLNLNRSTGNGAFRINQDHLTILTEAARKMVGENAWMAPPSAAELLSLKGVIDTEDEGITEDGRAALEKTLLSSLERAARTLITTRAEEGGRLEEALSGFLSTLEGLLAAAGGCAEAQTEAIRARLKEQVAELVADIAALDQGRLEQEAALVMSKADIREELDRLAAHLASAREMIAGGGAIGRRLDFLCQELNREANTICSKAHETALTRIGLDMKATVEQFREQVQNIE